MKKLIILLLTAFSFPFASESSNISLTGDFSASLGNPFRVILEKKESSISVFSLSSDIVFPVKSNSVKNKNLYPSSINFKNESIINVLKNYYSEQYFVNINKGNIELNVLSGNVELDFVNFQDQDIEHLSKVIVTLNVEFIKNGIKTLKTISMDQNLNMNKDSYKLSITIDKIKNINFNNLNENIIEIIENELYTIIKGVN